MLKYRTYRVKTRIRQLGRLGCCGGLGANLLSTGQPFYVALNADGSTSTGTNDPQCVAAGKTGGPYPNCTTPPSAGLAEIPWYLWALGAIAAYYAVK